ncbi:MAG: NTP transferase domain-containing protein, partial [Rhodospirillaceae bacterium]|nr:NTP transferase domain-containing protein [Rhodospirillaceae bacterium]
VLRVDPAVIDAVNRIDEAVTVATLADYAAVQAGQIVATAKIIPYAVGGRVMGAVRAALTATPLALAAYRPKRTAIISTTTPHLKASIIGSTEAVTARRIIELGGTVLSTARIPHDAVAVAAAVKEAVTAGADQILISGASATADRADTAPAGILRAGGTIEHFGMPVDPGNLLVLGQVKKIPVLVLPGCARSPRLNGADWVMQRLAAGIAITGRDIMGMGVGGLLVDTPARPLPRARAVKEDRAPEIQPGPDTVPDAETEDARPRIAIVLLAAGQSRRMGPHNKLVMPLAGKPLVRRMVETILAARPAQVVVVTGHEPAVVAAAVAGLPVAVVHNPRYREGLSTSLQAGLAAVAPDMEGAMICLADMPSLTPDHVAKLMAGFDPAGGKAIGVPTHNGKRGNPVLWARELFVQMREIAGDVGAKALIGANESLVYEVEFGDTAVLTDLDTPEQWSEYVAKGSGA